uniref:Uncharacterized protein n=1 Tax=Anguilla anguilla TaxID=7936 RepID=A0A0E9Q5Z9_ANGAN
MTPCASQENRKCLYSPELPVGSMRVHSVCRLDITDVDGNLIYAALCWVPKIMKNKRE